MVDDMRYSSHIGDYIRGEIRKVVSWNKINKSWLDMCNTHMKFYQG